MLKLSVLSNLEHNRYYQHVQENIGDVLPNSFPMFIQNLRIPIHFQVDDFQLGFPYEKYFSQWTANHDPHHPYEPFLT